MNEVLEMQWRGFGDSTPSWTCMPSPPYIYFLSLSMLHHHHPYSKASLTLSPTNPSIKLSLTEYHITLTIRLHVYLIFSIPSYIISVLYIIKWAIYTLLQTKKMCLCGYLFYYHSDYNHFDKSTHHLQPVPVSACRFFYQLVNTNTI